VNGNVNTPGLRWRMAIAALVVPGIAFAYVDPGTGAYLVQSIMALVGIVTFYATRPFRFLRNLFARRIRPDAED
jgi:hypothetical protein